MKYLIGCVLVLAAASCASVPPNEEGTETSGGAKSAEATPAGGRDAGGGGGATGEVGVTMANIAGEAISGRLELRDEAGKVVVTIPVADGRGAVSAPVGRYRAYVYGYDEGTPVLIDVRDVAVDRSRKLDVSLELTEGSGTLSLLHFDQDYDFVLDRLEVEQGTNPQDASSFPGAEAVALPTTVIRAEKGWFAGEMHAHSKYDPYGTESVGDLIRRAEAAGLDFLAIADRNTLAASEDPQYSSSKLALIPAMEWGSDEQGVALIYGPRTRPVMNFTFGDAQSMVVRQQAQGAFVAIAHPCFPTMPWQWGLSYMSGVEVWAREWSGVPPAVPLDLDEPALERRDDVLIHSIARAVATRNQSANGQASLFYDMELVRQLKASVIAGSLSGSPEVPIGRPVTYVFAQNQSAPAILEGLKKGRTFVTSGVDGPRVFLRADVMSDGKIDVPMVGGSVPIGVKVTFQIIVFGANGKKMQLLRNGVPIRSVWVDDDSYAWNIMQLPDSYSDFRVRIVDAVERGPNTYGFLKVLAMTSPIYAEDILADIVGPNLDPSLFSVRIKSYYDDYNRVQQNLPSDPSRYEIRFNR